MNRFKILPYSIYLAGLLALGGCASDTLPDEPVTAPDDSQFWLTFQLSPSSNSSDAPNNLPADTRATRADDDPVDKEPDEQTVSSVMALIYDTDNNGNPTTLVSTAKANYTTVTSPKKEGTIVKNGNTGTYTVYLNMGFNNMYTRKHLYRLYVFANTNYSNLPTIFGSPVEDLKAATATIEPKTDIVSGTSPGLPLGTTNEDALKIAVYLKEKVADGGVGDYSTVDNAYTVQVSTENINDQENASAGTLMLTPLHARFDFEAKTDNPNFIYPIKYLAGTDETGNTPNHTEVKVQFLKCKVNNCAKNVYFVKNVNATNNKIVKSEDLTSETAQTGGEYEVKAGILAYIPEYVPNYSTTVSSNTHTYADVTYMDLIGILQWDSDCNAINENVRKALTGEDTSHPDLYYYDDGNFQSGLTTKNKSGQAHWIKVSYDNAYGGYVVTYRHAIRHDAVGSGATNDDDGVIYPMEYGVVRNYIYKIGIASVNALPHPFDTDLSKNPVETPNKDINVTISTPTKWKTWHREVFEVNPGF